MGIRNIGFLTDKDQTVKEVIKELGDIPEGTKMSIRKGMLFTEDSVEVTFKDGVDILSEIPENVCNTYVEALHYYTNKPWIIIEI